MEKGWHQDPNDSEKLRWHDGNDWTIHTQKVMNQSVPKTGVREGDRSGKLMWVGVVSAAIGAILGLMPRNACGSAWVPEACMPGVHSSAATISAVFLVIAGAAIITSLATSK